MRTKVTSLNSDSNALDLDSFRMWGCLWMSWRGHEAEQKPSRNDKFYWNETHPFDRFAKIVACFTCTVMLLKSTKGSLTEAEAKAKIGHCLVVLCVLCISLLSLLLASLSTLERTIFWGTVRETAQQLHQQLDAGHHKLAIYVRWSGAVQLTDVTACLWFKGKLDSIDEAEDLINEVENTATWHTHGLAWVATLPQITTLKRRTCR